MGTKNGKIKVVFLCRKPLKMGNFSIEIYFRLVRENLKDHFVPVYREMPFLNTGFFNRLGNAVYCFFNQGDINHITGDIHYVTAFLKKKKTILTVLDCGMMYQAKGIKYKVFKWLWYTIPNRHTAKFTAISHATKEDVIKFTGCDDSKVKVVYVSINAAFTKQPKTFNAAEPRILQIGTAFNKNIERLVEALKGIPCKLIIVGKVQENIIASINNNGINYEIIDRRLTDEEIILEYQKCDILSFISTLEGFGMPIVEANATGRVVITGNVTSMPEVAGNAAHLVDPFSVDEMKNGFLKIINDEEYRNKLIENGYSNCKRFSIETITAEYIKLYSEIAETL
jgi:glycosyltransferase involved in cell wall biosynthesis